MKFASSLKSTLLMGAIATAVAGCIGNVGGPEDSDELVAQREEALLHGIDPAKELVITDLSVIESPEETTFDPARKSGTHKRGAWSFGRLVHNMLPKGKRDDSRAASKLTFGLLSQWESDQQPNDMVSLAPARARIRDEVIDPWKAASGCKGSDESCVLDMRKAPFRLIAIVYRPDLRKLGTPGDPGIGGEGRFVFELVSKTATEAAARTKKMTVIFEYTLPVHNNVETLLWAYRWHTLGALPVGPLYNAALRTITNDFAGPDADKRRPNGNALSQLRTNEVILVHPTPGDMGRRWELREFHLTKDGFAMHPVGQEPSRDFDVAPRGTRSAELGDWLVANAEAVKSNTHTIPASWLGNSSLVGTGFGAWGSGAGGPIKTTAGVAVPDDVRKAFAVNTCAGCHRHETDTRSFLHLTDRRALDPLDANDAANLPPASTPEEERQTVLSFFLQDEISPPTAAQPEGGPRYADFAKLLRTKPWELFEKPGLRVCASY